MVEILCGAVGCGDVISADTCVCGGDYYYNLRLRSYKNATRE